MTWWNNTSDSGLQLKQKYNFKLFMDNFVYTAKSADRPKASIEVKSYQLINHNYKYPGIVTWDPINVTIVDFENIGEGTFDTKTIWEALKASGYNVPDGSNGSIVEYPYLTTPAKNLFKSGTFKGQEVKIQTIDNDGKEIETWELYNPIISKIDWGSHEYGSDEGIEITLTIEYDYAKLT